MGSRWKNFKSMLKDFWQENMENHYKKISAGLGTLIIISFLALVDVAVSYFSGKPIDFGIFMTKVSIAVGVFVTLLASSFFGNDKNNNKSKEVSEEPHE